MLKKIVVLTLLIPLCLGYFVAALVAIGLGIKNAPIQPALDRWLSGRFPEI